MRLSLYANIFFLASTKLSLGCKRGGGGVCEDTLIKIILMKNMKKKPTLSGSF